MSKIRIGIVGSGNRGIHSFGNFFANIYADHAEVVAVADKNRERATRGLAYIDVKADIHDEPAEMLARKDIDAVVITTPDYLHEEYAVLALEHGKHVLVDKPLATTARGCLRIIEASKRAGKLLFMGFNLRQECVVRQVKRMIDANALGEIFTIHAIEHYDGGRTYMSRWNRLKKYSGGLFVHKGSHDFDIINWFMGTARPVRVSCFANVSVLKPEGLPFKPREGVKPGPTCSKCAYREECPDVIGRGRPPMAEDPGRTAHRKGMYGEAAAAIDGYHVDLCMYLSDKDTHDQGIAIIEYDNGATASHSECFFTPFSNRRYLIDGTLGHVDADLRGNRVDFFPRWTKDRIIHHLHRDPGGHGGSDPKMCREFIACLEQGIRPTASGIDGAWSVAVAEAAELARAERRVVEISEVLDVDSDLLQT